MDISSAYKLNNGIEIPVFGFGTYKLLQGEAYDSVSCALRTGYRLIDTAAYYQNESDVGKAVRESGILRGEIFVATKIWNTDHANPLAAFEKSLRLLNTGYIDLYMIHWPVPERKATWKALLPLLKTPRVRSLGVCNFSVRHLEELLAATGTVPAVNQVEFSPFLYQKELLGFCKKHKIQLVAYAPLTRSSKFSHPSIAELSAKHSCTPAQILLRWCVQHGVIPIPKSKTFARIEENAAIFGFSLSEKEMAKLDSLNEDFRLTWNPDGMP